MSDKTIIAYKIERPDCGGWMHAGVTVQEVCATLANELDFQEGLGVDERGTIHIVPYETTQEEIDALPEFEGW